jgi:hypothetical protein
MRRCAPTSHKQRCLDDDQVDLEPSLANTYLSRQPRCDPIIVEAVTTESMK